MVSGPRVRLPYVVTTDYGQHRPYNVGRAVAIPPAAARECGRVVRFPDGGPRAALSPVVAGPLSPYRCPTQVFA